MSTTTTTRASRSSRNIRAGNLSPATFSPFGSVIQNPATHDGEPRELQSVSANQGTATKWVDVTLMHDFYDQGPSRRKARCVMNMFVCEARRLERRGKDGKAVFPVKVLERHPFTPQTFVPMGVSAGDRNVRYLVIVAPTLPSSSSATRQTTSSALPPPAYPPPESKPKPSLKDRLLGARPNPYANTHSPTTTPVSADESSLPTRQGSGPPDLDNIQAFIARGDQAVTYGAGTWHAPMVVLGEKAIEFVVVQYANGVGNEDCQEVEITVADGGEGLAVEVGEVEAVKAKL